MACKNKEAWQLTALWTIISFVSGSLPFSVWIGRLFLQTDIRRYGDHNPGATNVVRAGGWPLGVLAAVLDISKGAIPVGLAWYWLGLDGWSLAPISLAPILGHAFSPFLKFRGGKAIAVTGGVWLGLLGLQGFGVILALFLMWYALVSVDGWSVLLALASLLIYLLLAGYGAPVLVVWLGNSLVIAWKHRDDLAQPPQLRAWLRKAGRLT